MKGQEVEATVICPLCGTSLRAKPESSKNGSATARHAIRRTTGSHLVKLHPHLGVRDRSLICDAVADRILDPDNEDNGKDDGGWNEPKDDGHPVTT